MRCSLSSMLALTLCAAASAALGPPVGAQTSTQTVTARDTAHVATQKVPLDTVTAGLAQYCATKVQNQTVKMRAACRNYTKLGANESALLVGSAAPPTPAPTPSPSPAPAPTPTDSTQPELPRVYLDTRLEASPAGGNTVRAASDPQLGSDLQAVLDGATCGDRVLLPAGVSFRGNYVLHQRCSAGAWILVMTEGCTTLPAENVRISPAAASCYAKLVSPTVLPPLSVAASAASWRIIGVEFVPDQSQRVSNTLVELGDGAATTTSQLPRRIILDRVYVHGLDSTDVHRCIGLNADSVAVIDSYVANCHMRGIDAQAAWGWNANGPFKLVNNYLEASSEVFGFGGADPGIPNLVPSDIEFRRNYLSKPMAWKGGPWLIKNMVEFKNARRALIDGNVFENSWPQAQLGWAFVLWSVNQQGSCTWCVTRDVTITNNIMRSVAAGFQLSSTYGGAPNMSHVAIRNNVMIGVDNPLVSGGGYGVLTQGEVDDLTIEHNTFFVPTISALQWGAAGQGPLVNHVVRNNLTGGATYSLFASPTNSWAAFTGSGSVFAGNVVARGADFAAGYPTANSYPATVDDIGLAGGASAAFSATAAPSDLSLSASSPYKAKATDGKDPGADVAAVLAATQGVKP